MARAGFSGWLVSGLCLAVGCASGAGPSTATDAERPVEPSSTDGPPALPPDTGIPFDTGVDVDAGAPVDLDGGGAVDAPMKADVRPARPVTTCGQCAAYAAPMAMGMIGHPSLDEASGLGASRAHAGVIYSHNDRGNGPEVFALGRSGALVGRFILVDAPALDVEDLALGPCPQGTCIYLADTGNNRADRSEFALLRIAEPDVEADDPFRSEAVAFERFPLRYEDGPHDVEAMVVDPASGQVYLITKPLSGPSSVYKMPLPLTKDVVTVARKWVTLPVPRSADKRTTGASAHPCAPRLLLRTYESLYEFRAPAGGTLEDAFKAAPSKLIVANELFAEAVGYSADGLGFVTVSEGKNPPLHHSRCAP